MSNLYERINVKQLSIDNKRIRKKAPKNTIYWDAPQKSVKRCDICVDAWKQGKILTMMAYQHQAQKEVVTKYYLDIENGVVRKQNEALRYLVRHHKKIIESRFVECTKSKAIEKLAKLMNA